jgi:hypothetical protein
MTGLRSAVSCFDRLFDKASGDKYFLSIRFQPDGLFLSVFDTEIRKYIAFESVVLAGAIEIYEYVSRHSFLTGKFQKTICIVPSSKYTIIPDALFLPGNEDEYFSFVHELSVGEELNSVKLQNEDAQLIFAADMSYFEIIREFFPTADVIPVIASFTGYLLPRFRTTTEPAMFLNIYTDNFDLLILHNGKINFCNNFNWNAPEDIVYYTIFVIEQLKINAEKVVTSLSGNISAKSDIFKLMRKYIKTVDMLTYDQEVQLSYALSEVNLYNYPDLFNPRLCE